MSDSIKQLLEDMLKQADAQREKIGINVVTHYDDFANRLGALIGEPGNAVLTTGARNRNADMSGNHFDYTIPLYRLDGKK